MPYEVRQPFCSEYPSIDPRTRLLVAGTGLRIDADTQSMLHPTGKDRSLPAAAREPRAEHV